ncbi:MAG: class B sortase [Butyrivibrio sp.]|jgi:sortase B|nr:class B sortase [Butyrivibrio sp.]
MNKRVSLLILILKPFAKLYRLIVPKGGHRGFAFFTSSLLSMIIALSIIGSVLAKRNIKNSFYSVADAQDTSEEVSETNTQQASAGELLKQANSTDEQDQASANSNVLSDAESDNKSGDGSDTNNISSETGKDSISASEEQASDETIADSGLNTSAEESDNGLQTEETVDDEEGLYLFSAAPNTGDDSDGSVPTTAEDTGSDYLIVNEDAENWYDMYTVDFATLDTINPDIVGWVVWENEDISYPILYSGDNSTYLDTSFDGKELDSGSIFIDGRNTFSFDDDHNIVYGHNMKNLSMFGKLRYYKEDDSYYDDHKYIQVILPDRTERYEIFAYNTVKADSIVYNVSYDSVEDYAEFINYICLASYNPTGIYVTTDDKILTFSTCTSSDDKRFVVHAVKMDEAK